MTAKANWHVAPTIPDDEPDPFAMPIEEVGQRIKLTDPQGALTLRLVELVRREGRLYNAQITCAIKGDQHSCCHACPVSKAHVPADRLSALCKLGREQERVLTELAVLGVNKPCPDETE